MELLMVFSGLCWLTLLIALMFSVVKGKSDLEHTLGKACWGTFLLSVISFAFSTTEGALAGIHYLVASLNIGLYCNVIYRLIAKRATSKVVRIWLAIAVLTIPLDAVAYTKYTGLENLSDSTLILVIQTLFLSCMMIWRKVTDDIRSGFRILAAAYGCWGFLFLATSRFRFAELLVSLVGIALIGAAGFWILRKAYNKLQSKNAVAIEPEESPADSSGIVNL